MLTEKKHTEYLKKSFYAKMSIFSKIVLKQAHLETSSYQTMVQHLEREMELNELENPDTTSLTDINIVGQEPNTNQ